MAPCFEPEEGGHMVDQAWQPRLAEGMVRAHLVEDRVTGFGRQAVNALVPARDGEPAPPPGPRLYHGPDLAQPGQAERYVLFCEINVSSVSPFPPSSIEPLVAATQARLVAD
jgi:hypothetical protein